VITAVLEVAVIEVCISEDIPRLDSSGRDEQV
jgi:hypothetical protein